MSEPVVRWSSLLRGRPRLPDLLGSGHFIGYTDIRAELVKRLERPGPIELFLISGGKGSGKSAIARWLAGAAPERTILADDSDAVGVRTLDPNGTDVARLIGGLRERLAAIGPTAVLLYDDAHADLTPLGITRFVRAAAQGFDLALLVVLTATSTSADFTPIPTTTSRLERRQADFDDFNELLDKGLRAAEVSESAFSDALRHSLHELSEQTSNYAAVEFVIEMLMAYHQDTGHQARVDTLHRLLVDHDDGQDRVRRYLPAVRRTDDRWMTFRRKDKTELLAELLLRHLNDPAELADIADSTFDDFDRRTFLVDARTSYRDAVTVQCLTRSPVDLVNGLLGRAIVQKEIQDLDLDPNQLFRETEDRTDLLIRGLGFSVTGEPEGLPTYLKVVDRAAVAAADRQSKVVDLKGFQKIVVETVEEVMRDLVHFWGAHLFGSLSSLIEDYNRESKRRRLVLNRLQMGDLAALLRYINAVALRDDQAFKLSFIDVRQPFPEGLLKACDAFLPLRNEFAHGYFTDDPDELRGLLGQLVESARGLLVTAASGAFPGVIKLSEILFDEYGRRIFSGVDAGGQSIRFALTDDTNEEPVVSSHYYMLPLRPVSVNPLLIRVDGSAQVLFDDAEAYEAAATVQHQQGETLLQYTIIGPADRVIDIGCGPGDLTLEIASRVPEGAVVGLDKSADMIARSEERSEAAAVPNASFVTADLLTYATDERFDLAISNSTMHWILPPEIAYEKLFQLVRPGGRISVHQGGHGCYRGLWRLAWRVIDHLGLRNHYYHNFDYPAYYPEPFAFRELLQSIGFVDVDVKSVESDGREYPDLIKSFSQAGLLPFLAPLPVSYQDSFRSAFIRRAMSEPPDLYTHRLFARAVRP